MEEKEVSDEQYASISALIDRMLQNEAGLMRAIEQANTLVSWSKAHDYQLFFTDDSIGRYLFENANMDQYRGAVLLFYSNCITKVVFFRESAKMRCKYASLCEKWTASAVCGKICVGRRDCMYRVRWIYCDSFVFCIKDV